MNDKSQTINEDWNKILYKDAVYKISTTKQKDKSREVSKRAKEK